MTVLPDFEPLVVESIGGWNLEGKNLLKKIAARVAMESFLEEKTLLRDKYDEFFFYLSFFLNIFIEVTKLQPPPSVNKCPNDVGTDLYLLIQFK
jgi:hypothetical protein